MNANNNSTQYNLMSCLQIRTLMNIDKTRQSALIVNRSLAESFSDFNWKVCESEPTKFT